MSTMAGHAKKRGRYHHGDLRDALVRASIELITESGVEALSLRAVARRLGVSHAAPQHHFANKDALLTAVAAEGFASLGEALERAAARKETPLEKLKAAGVAYVRFAARRPAHFRVMFGPHLARSAQPVPDPGASVLLDASRAVAEQAGEPQLAETISLAAWSLVHGLAMLWLDGPLARVMGRDPSGQQLEEIARAITDLVGRSLGQ